MVRWKISLRRKKVYKREHERGISLREGKRRGTLEFYRASEEGVFGWRRRGGANDEYLIRER